MTEQRDRTEKGTLREGKKDKKRPKKKREKERRNIEIQSVPHTERIQKERKSLTDPTGRKEDKR